VENALDTFCHGFVFFFGSDEKMATHFPHWLLGELSSSRNVASAAGVTGPLGLTIATVFT
jgi:hypothetical protein